ncbi:hypothetical protein E6C27_scaffold43053G00170 [Cucumis melo var. makuwa]|uniref:Uncharacterized protein n=1 Tax=Cucumis melo var. makuwa TaxID=1194695 RepID=A0A5A7SPV6_CUCMM|nr:hypothetical protein E6C27_scaffold43053G00170 [Cucumis melo var. makuwa]
MCLQKVMIFLFFFFIILILLFSQSLAEVTPLSVIQLLLGDDQIHRPSKSDWTSSSFGEVTLPSAIQLLLNDDRAFTVRSIALVRAIRHLRRLERSDRTSWRDRGEATPSSSFGERETKLHHHRHFGEGGKVAPSTSSWRDKGGAAPSSSSQNTTY